MIRKIYKRFGKWFLKPVLQHDFSKEIAQNERPIEYAFVFKCLSALYPETILDVGTGKSSLPHLMKNCGFNVMAIDNISDYWHDDIWNRHYLVAHDDITMPKLSYSFDCITCISVLEHIHKHNEAIKGMFSLLNPNGHLILTFPYNEKNYIPDINKENNCKINDYFLQVFSRKEINNWLKDNNGEIMNQEYYDFFEGSYWRSGNIIVPPIQADIFSKHHLTCLLIKKK